MNTIPLAMAAGILVYLVGCAANRPYRTRYTPCDTTANGADCTNAVIETTPDYKLGFVEFDEQGWFWDRRQLDSVEWMIRGEARLDGVQQDQGVVIIVFVHGWKNNAAYDNTNVVMFRSVLKDLAQVEQARNKTLGVPARRIVGVYAAWRGLSAELEPFKELSFYERKNTAHKIGTGGGLVELLARVQDLQAESNKSVPQSARTELIIVGHSFGGAAVYSATSQILTQGFVDTINHNKPLKPLGDLVILLNPAFEASRHFNMNELATQVARYPEGQRPVLAVFTSKGDWATRYAFPVGRFFTTILERNRPDKPQWTAELETIGNYQPFITHDLVYDPKAKDTATNAVSAQTGIEQSVLRTRMLHRQWLSETNTATAYSFDQCVLQPRAPYKAGDPLLIVSVDKQIMHDHDDITNPLLVNFLREFIMFSRANAGEK